MSFRHHVTKEGTRYAHNSNDAKPVCLLLCGHSLAVEYLRIRLIAIRCLHWINPWSTDLDLCKHRGCRPQYAFVAETIPQPYHWTLQFQAQEDGIIAHARLPLRRKQGRGLLISVFS